MYFIPKRRSFVFIQSSLFFNFFAMKKKVNYFSNPFGCIINDNVILCRREFFSKVNAIQSIKINERSFQLHAELTAFLSLIILISHLVSKSNLFILSFSILLLQIIILIHWQFSWFFKLKIVMKDQTIKVFKVKIRYDRDAIHFFYIINKVLENNKKGCKENPLQPSFKLTNGNKLKCFMTSTEV